MKRLEKDLRVRKILIGTNRKQKTRLKRQKNKIFINNNNLENYMTYNSFETGCDREYIKRLEKQKPKKNYLLKTMLALAVTAAAFSKGYDLTRPTIRGEVIGKNLSNEQAELYLRNEANNTIDTIVVLDNNGDMTFTLGSPANFTKKELKERITPGSLLEARLYNNDASLKKLYNIREVIPR